MKIEEMFQQAKEELLKKGKYNPQMFVEFRADGKESGELIYFADFGAETQTEENMQFFGLGVKFAEEHKGVGIEFTQITFFSEAWTVVATTPEERKKWKRPQHAPNRKESLVAMIVEIEGKSLRQSLYRAEMLRTGDSLDLGPEEKIEMPWRPGSMTFPMYFLAGYTSTQATPEQMAEIIKQAQRMSRS